MGGLFFVHHPDEGTLDVEYLHDNGTWKKVSEYYYSPNYKYYFPTSSWSSHKIRYILPDELNIRKYMKSSYSKASGLNENPTRKNISDKIIEYTFPTEWDEVYGEYFSVTFSTSYKPELRLWRRYNVEYDYLENPPDPGPLNEPVYPQYYDITFEGFTKAEQVICNYPYTYHPGWISDIKFRIYIEADITDILSGFDLTVIYEDTIEIPNTSGMIGSNPSIKSQTVHVKGTNDYNYELDVPIYSCSPIGPNDIPISTPGDVAYMGRFNKRTYGRGTEHEVLSDGGPLKKYYLTNNIDMTGWIVPKREIYNLDGRGFTIKNLATKEGDAEFIHFQSQEPM